MKKISKLAVIASTAIIAASASAQSVPASTQQVNDNWVNGTGEHVWMNGTNQLCWRDAHWTPATANAKCDGSMVSGGPVSDKITYQADALFDFDKTIIKPAGRAKLDDLASKIRNINLEVVVATGYTDRIGSEAYNQRLSLRRAQAVKNYLVSHGVPKDRIYTEGKGEMNPVAACLKNITCGIISCLAPNRRVDVEVIGTPKTGR